MGLIKLNVHKRTTAGKNENRRTRAAGFIPAVLYGNDRAATPVQIETREFTNILQKSHGRSVIYDLQIEGEKDRPLALMRELQRHPVRDVIQHVDLFEIPRDMPVTVSVALVLEGEPACVKFNEGELLQLMDAVELNCQPRDLPDAVRVDVSNLALNDKLFIKDLTAPVGEIMDDPESQVLVLKPVSLFVEETAAAAEGDAGAAKEAETSDEK